MSRALNVSLATFEDEVLDSKLPVVVDFYADWCGPCRMLGPILDRLATSYEGRAKIVKVNIDQEPDLAQQFDVSSIPTLAFVVGGEVVAHASGLPSEADLMDVIEQMVALSSS